MNNKEKLFVAVVDKKYESFIPIYIYFCQRAYKDADIAIYFRGNLSPKIYEMLKFLEVYENYTIIENYKIDYGSSPHITKVLRWTIHDDLIKKYTYAYIGDVDIAISKENPDLFAQHIDHMDRMGSVFSNIKRTRSKKISGLHFIKTYEYFNYVDSVIEEFDRKLFSMKDKYEYFFEGHNETFLYNILRKAGILDSILTRNQMGKICTKIHFRPHHGVHLICFKNRKRVITYCLNKYSEKNNYIIDFLKAFKENDKLQVSINAFCDAYINKLFQMALFYLEKYFS